MHTLSKNCEMALIQNNTEWTYPFTAVNKENARYIAYKHRLCC
jgi:hypothetical protein